jgi:hypothetical protein
MLIFGIIALVTGKFTLTRNKVVRGVPARIIGVILVLAFPLAILVLMAIGAVFVAQGQPIIMGSKAQLTMTLVEAGIIVGCFLIALVIAAMTAGPPERTIRRRRRRDPEDEDEDERPRRRRRDPEEEEEEERPRRRPRARDEEETPPGRRVGDERVRPRDEDDPPRRREERYRPEEPEERPRRRRPADEEY